MKKTIVFSLLALLLSFGVARAYSLNLPPVVDPNIIGPSSDVDPIIDDEPIISENQMIKPSSTPLWLILASQCKMVEYTDWSECNHNFGTNGFMFRKIIYPTPGNCIPTTNQQIATLSDCNIIE